MVTSSLIIYTTIRVALFMPIVGYFYELFGRRIALFLLLFMLFAFFLAIPFSSPNFHLFAFARTGCFVTNTFIDYNPLIPDYIMRESRGQAIAL